jgi:LacI family transcriptional regulator
VATQDFGNAFRPTGSDHVVPFDGLAAGTTRRTFLSTATKTKILAKKGDSKYPVGIFCYNDYVAADIIGICLDSHIHIPEQVAVIGVDDDPIVAGHVPVPLSSVRHDLEGWLTGQLNCWIN